MTINEMKVGDSYALSRTVTETLVDMFAGVSGDLNPAHTDEVAASKTMFKGRIAHGMLSAGFISAAIGMHLPGPGTIYVGQTLNFTAPVHIGDTVTATVTVKEVNVEKNRAILETVCTNQDGKVVIKGEGKGYAPQGLTEDSF